MTQQRTKVLGAVLGIVVVAALTGWWGFTQVKSPADVAARTAAPTPSPILVPVEERVLSTSVVTRGTARFGLPQPDAVHHDQLGVQRHDELDCPLQRDMGVRRSVDPDDHTFDHPVVSSLTLTRRNQLLPSCRKSAQDGA